ncbi:MAG: sigma-54-dependent Fis family transcriptional regulator [Gemmatimonadetes bacterium]|nr:sigma-54-dependent Fis family transcriptional regulator [Gemmatimonadota bacterium]
MEPTILIVDDEENIRTTLELFLSERGFGVESVGTGEAAVEMVQEREVAAVVLDLNLPGMDGIETMGQLRRLQPELPIIIVTAFGSIPSAVEAMRQGSYDYVAKPFRNDDLLMRLERGLENSRLRLEVEQLRSRLGEATPFARVIGESASMREALERAQRVADRNVTVLLLGESGTGKEVLARAIHEASRRTEERFVAVNCGAIPDELVENELFGHEKGAYTDARERREGRFEQAAGGTLFLDEIGEMPLTAQPKLLRALEAGEITRLGGAESVQVDVRVIAATNRNLEEEVREGRFREDLFYRLNVFAVRIPPLRERAEDVPLLVEHLAQKCAPLLEVEWAGIAEGALQLLQGYGWPGNVRELENALQGALLMANGCEIEAVDLPPSVRGDTGETVEAPGLAQVVAQVERRVIRQALQVEGFNHTRAAKRLKITRQTLLYKIQAYGLEEGR